MLLPLPDNDTLDPEWDVERLIRIDWVQVLLVPLWLCETESVRLDESVKEDERSRVNDFVDRDSVRVLLASADGDAVAKVEGLAVADNDPAPVGVLSDAVPVAQWLTDGVALPVSVDDLCVLLAVASRLMDGRVSVLVASMLNDRVLVPLMITTLKFVPYPWAPKLLVPWSSAAKYVIVKLHTFLRSFMDAETLPMSS